MLRLPPWRFTKLFNQFLGTEIFVVEKMLHTVPKLQLKRNAFQNPVVEKVNEAAGEKHNSLWLA